MSAINLGNVVGLIKSETPPPKPYVLWGKILDPQEPEIVQLKTYKGVGDITQGANWDDIPSIPNVDVLALYENEVGV